jgi:hypothetical protein
LRGPIDHHEQFRRIFAKYELIFKAGGDARLIYRVAQVEGLEMIVRLKILRSLFNFSFVEAKIFAEELDQSAQ